MKLILIHGAPAAGKLTVGRHLASITGWKLFHNHLAVDLALCVYDFGSPGFVAVREEVWLSVLRRANADGLSALIFTFNPENTVPQGFVDLLFSEFGPPGGRVFSVRLTAPEAEIERRLAAVSRQAHGKLTDAALYRGLRASGAFTRPVIPRVDLVIDTSVVEPAGAAKQIAAAVGPS